MVNSIIYKVLTSKPHNLHYLNRYIKFIEGCKIKNSHFIGYQYTESHHICPKANELFPEYAKFHEFPWNKVDLNSRQHIMAHVILWLMLFYGKYSAVHKPQH